MKVYAAEAYEGPLTYTLDHENADGVTGLRYVFNVNVQAGDLLTMTLDVPSETRTGETINVDIHKGDDSEFLVRAGTDTSRPWIEITLSTFQDVLFYMEPDAHHLEFLLYDQMGVDTLHASDGALILTRDGNPIIWAF
ncbi:MAG: hypothetical protein HRU18_06695 [Pseudoalteromonas sp.]|uniref:hypothetical protein n=1 Tax=Pseudoalteromonas sp. TaxID=53249 RepID=UPI001D23C3FD|nr:hypothetical protein [Pseudoalteromonas sp.]NRA77878.1 hypothetical protein [Pseudoalteromonas sp.]